MSKVQYRIMESRLTETEEQAGAGRQEQNTEDQAREQKQTMWSRLNRQVSRCIQSGSTQGGTNQQWAAPKTAGGWVGGDSYKVKVTVLCETHFTDETASFSNSAL